jgi:hypothetical protein
MRQETINLINNYTGLNDTTKNALNACIRSDEVFYENDGTLVEDNLDLDHASRLQSLNEDIKARFGFDRRTFKRAYLATRLTEDLLDKPVFARSIENKYFEQITTFEYGKFNYEKPIVPKETINNLSETIETGLSKTELVHWSRGVLDALNTEANFPTGLSNIDSAIIEQICMDLFLNNFNNFSMFINKINSIEDLSSVVFSSITFKICLKLTPLIAAKFLLNYSTDPRIKEFYKKIHSKCNFRIMLSGSFGKTKSFLLDYKRTFSVGFLGVTLYTMFDKKYFNTTTLKEVTEIVIIIPAVELFVDHMEAIKANATAVVYSISSTAGAIADSFYKGFRDSLIKSWLELFKEAMQIAREIKDKK